MHDKRKTPRLRCSFPALAEGPRGPVRGTCTNLSMGGLFLEGAQLAVDTRTSVTVDLGEGRRLTAQASVRHHTAAPRGMGVQFLRIEQAQLELLQAVLAQLAQG